jgi:hypothetical protein
MTEQQKYDLLATHGDLEIRRYLPYVAADVLVAGDYESAANKGFRPLANYIFGNNISMTAPVLVEAAPENQWRVSFVMPGESQLESMPTPNPGVGLRASEGGVCAAISFRGYTTGTKIRRMGERLKRALQEQGLQVTGMMRIARFDPPWKPGFARHNEVIVPISWG